MTASNQLLDANDALISGGGRADAVGEAPVEGTFCNTEPLTDILNPNAIISLAPAAVDGNGKLFSAKIIMGRMNLTKRSRSATACASRNVGWTSFIHFFDATTRRAQWIPNWRLAGWGTLGP